LLARDAVYLLVWFAANARMIASISIVHSKRMLLALITGIAQPWPGAKGTEQAVLVSLSFLLCDL